MGKDDARIRILEAAGPVFAEKGFQAATVRGICEAAKMNLASINYYFGDKQQLYVEAVKYAHEPPGEEVEETDWPAGTPTQEKLKGYILTALKRMLGVRATWQRQLVMREILQPTSACKQLVEGHFRARFNRLLDILDEVLPPTHPHTSDTRSASASSANACIIAWQARLSPCWSARRSRTRTTRWRNWRTPFRGSAWRRWVWHHRCHNIARRTRTWSQSPRQR